MMNKVFTDNGWEDYTYWQTEDKKTLKRKVADNLNSLLYKMKEESLIDLRWEYKFWSRRINDKDRLIYKIDDKNIYILSCRYHYNDK